MNKTHNALLTSVFKNAVLIPVFMFSLTAFSVVQAQQNVVENPMLPSAPVRYGSYSNSVRQVETPSVTTSALTKVTHNTKKGASAGSVNINSASETELVNLPGIGPSKAHAITEYRQQKGGFKSVDDLQQVKGIGPATLEKLRAHVTL